MRTLREDANSTTAKTQSPLLEVCDLVKHFRRHGASGKGEPGVLAAVDSVSLQVRSGEIVGLLGESGCGKTTLARMIMHLLEPTSGQILMDGVEVQGLSERRFRPLRTRIQMVYQNPFDCLDPRMRVSALLEEPMRLWRPELDRAQRREKITAMLAECGLGEECLTKRPGEFSGGQLQRISIARALLAQPQLLIADEIVSALDVPVQNQMLQLLTAMKSEHGFSVLFITHDLLVARKVSDRMMIMQAGRIVAEGPPDQVLNHSQNEYVTQLAQAVFTFNAAING